MPALLNLAISIAALALGPLLAGGLQRNPRLRAALDGFVLFVVGGLCIRFLLPHAYESLGAWAFAVALAGLLLPHLAERRVATHRHGEGRLILLLAVAGLLVHAAIDGANLALNSGMHGSHLPEETRLGLLLAITLHRLPVGLFLWWSVRPTLGTRTAVGLLVALAAATAAGFGMGGTLEAVGEGTAGGVLQALLAGGLLHIVSEHAPSAQLVRDSSRTPAAVGGLIGLGLFLMLPGGDNPVLRSALATTLTLLYESAPAILLGFLGAGLLSLVSTDWLLRRMSARNSLFGALKGIVLGLPLPICSCGVVPLYRGLARRGVPPAAAIAFLVATPELGMDAIILTVPLLGWKFAVLRVLAAFAVALVAGLVAGWLANRASGAPGHAGYEAHPEEVAELDLASEGGPARRVLRYGFGEMVDEMGPWILAGLLVAGALEPLLDQGGLLGLPGWAQVPLFALLGTPLYICASGATPVGAILLAKGVSPGAVLALLLAGPATNITTYGALRASHPGRHAWILLATVPLAAVLVGYAMNALGAIDATDAVDMHEHQPAWWQRLSAGLFVLLLVLSLLRQGPRGFLGQLGLGHDHGEDGEAHCCHQSSGGG